MSEAQVEKATEKEKEATLEQLVKGLPNRVFKREALLTVILLVLGAVGGYVGVARASDFIDARAEKATEKPISESEERTKKALAEQAARQQKALETLKAELKADIAEVKQQAAVKEERDGRRFELVINTILTGAPQPGTKALMRPPDGGP